MRAPTMNSYTPQSSNTGGRAPTYNGSSNPTKVSGASTEYFVPGSGKAVLTPNGAMQAPVYAPTYSPPQNVTNYDSKGNAYNGVLPGVTDYNADTGYLRHKSGYEGQATYRNGNYYTDYGALIREDGHFYQPGAILSQNGMYQDTGNGFEFSKYAVQSLPGQWTQYIPDYLNSYVPGQKIEGFDGQSIGGGSGNVAFSGGYYGDGGNTGNGAGNAGGSTGNTTPSVEDILAILNETSNNLRLQEWYEQQLADRGY